MDYVHNLVLTIMQTIKNTQISMTMSFCQYNGNNFPNCNLFKPTMWQ